MTKYSNLLRLQDVLIKNLVSVKEVSQSGNIIKEMYADDKSCNDVVLYTILNQGHAWPGGVGPRLKLLDNPTQEISATDLIWKFFVEHPKKKRTWVRSEGSDGISP